MKKSKKNKSQCLRSDGGRSAFFGNKSMLAAIGMLCLSPVFSVAFATGSDALHQMGGSTQVKESLQQQKKVTGTIVDQQGVSIPGASVQVKGVVVGTVTDIDGKFELEVPSGAVLIVSYIGM